MPVKTVAIVAIPGGGLAAVAGLCPGAPVYHGPTAAEPRWAQPCWPLRRRIGLAPAALAALAPLDRVVSKYRRDVNHLAAGASADALTSLEGHLQRRLPPGLRQTLPASCCWT